MYKLEVEGEARKTRAQRASAQAPVTSMDVIQVFAKKFSGVASRLNQRLINRLKSEVLSSGFSCYSEPSAEIQQMADVIGVDSKALLAFLYVKVKDFRNGMFEEGRGRLAGGTSVYAKTSGFELEAENLIVDQYRIYPGWKAKYGVEKKKYSPDEEKTEAPTDYREAQPEKYRRELPIPGEYASIQSLIKKHTLDGFLNKFAAYLITGKIFFADVNVASILGVVTPTGDAGPGAEAEDDNWLF